MTCLSYFIVSFNQATQPNLIIIFFFKSAVDHDFQVQIIGMLFTLKPNQFRLVCVGLTYLGFRWDKSSK